MGRMKFNIDGGAEAEANTGGGGVGYSGPTPPKGTYRVRLKRMELKMNKNDDPMFSILLEIAERKGSKLAKYNGYGVWHNLNVTDQGKGYVNGFLDALAGKSQVAQKKMRRAFWETGIVTEGKTDLGHVLKIGTTKVNSPDGELMMAISGKTEPDYKDKSVMRLIVGSFLIGEPSSDEDEDEEDEDEDDDDIEEDDDDVDVDEEDDEDEEEEDEDEEDGDDDDDDPDDDDAEDEDDDGDDEEDDDEEEEEEPEPVKKPARKRTTAAKRGRDAF